ncbi:MAG: hypothetical protein WBJ10_14735 [Daejeonella sp.]|uniref:hypothetical protein n=1 Tax=Daejeonella sp. TaxID=2805397 RepID=UPI003C7556D1
MKGPLTAGCYSINLVLIHIKPIYERYKSSSASFESESDTVIGILKHRSSYTQTPLNLYLDTACSTPDVHCNTGSGIVQVLFRNGSEMVQYRFGTGSEPVERYSNTALQGKGD